MPRTGRNLNLQGLLAAASLAALGLHPLLWLAEAGVSALPAAGAWLGFLLLLGICTWLLFSEQHTDLMRGGSCPRQRPSSRRPEASQGPGLKLAAPAPQATARRPVAAPALHHDAVRP